MCSDKEFASALGIYELILGAPYVRPSSDLIKKLFVGGVPARLEEMVFEPIRVCAQVPTLPLDSSVDIFHLGHEASFDAILDGISARGMRPLMDQEFIGLLLTYWHVQLAFELVALGSFTRIGSDRFVLSAFTHDANDSCLRLVSASVPFAARCRFPMVPIEE
ncbi:MAG: hypothetical protein ABIK13_00425 [Patescibacteria group bacterium]